MKKQLTRLALLLATLCSTTILHADWPEFRGRNGGFAPEGDLPVEWSPEKNVMWRSELPGEGWSSPIVVGDAAYLTAAIPDDPASDQPTYELALLTVDLNTGQLKNVLPLFTEGEDAPKIHGKNSHASSTPYYVDSRFYVHFGHQGTACVSLDGEIIWKNPSLGYTPVHGNGGSPVKVGDVVVFSRDGTDVREITALDAATGQVAWQTERDVETDRPFSFCTPLVVESQGRRQLILPGSNLVQSVDPKSGEELWRVTYEGFSVVPQPVYDSGLVFICTGFMRPSLLAIDPTGSGDVTETHVRWETNSNIPRTPSVVAFDGKVTVVSDDGIASCYAAESGELLWKKRIGGNFSASPIVAGDRLYVMSEEGVCTVLDIAGDPTEIAVNELGETCLASPAVVDNDLLIRTSAALYRIGTR